MATGGDVTVDGTVGSQQANVWESADMNVSSVRRAEAASPLVRPTPARRVPLHMIMMYVYTLF